MTRLYYRTIQLVKSYGAPVAAEPKKYYRIASLERGLKILELLSSLGHASLSEIAEHLGMDRSSCHRALLTMRDLGFVSQDQNTGFGLSLKVFEMAMRFADRLEVRKLVRPLMESLRDRHQETVNLGMLEGDHVVYLDRCESSEVVRADLAVGMRIPLHCTALGKAILAELPLPRCQEMVERIEFRPYTDATLTDPWRLMVELERVRRKGVAFDREELYPGLRCVAVALPAGAGGRFLALSVAGPGSRMSEEKMIHIGEELLEIRRRVKQGQL